MKTLKIIIGLTLTLGLVTGFAGCQVPEIKERKQITINL